MPRQKNSPTIAQAKKLGFPYSVIKKRKTTLETLGKLLGDDLGKFLLYLPPQTLVDSPVTVMSMAERYGASSWALFYLYETETPLREQAHRPALEALHAVGGDEPEKLFAAFSLEDFEHKLHGIISLTKKYEEALPAVMRLFRNDIWHFEAEHGALTDNAKKFYNITHIPRYVLPLFEGGYDVSLLEEAVKNNNPAYRPNRPLTLFVMNKDDPDSAFQNEYCTADLQRISEAYRLFIIETGSRLEAARAVEFASQQYASPAGSACIELLELAAHSCSTSMGFSRPSRRMSVRESQLHVNDAALFERIGRYIVPGGHVVLNGCSTNDRRSQDGTLYDTAQRAIPHATVHAPEAVLFCHHYQFNDAGKVTGVCFELGSQ